MDSMNLLLVHKLQQYQVRVPLDTTFGQLKVLEAHQCFAADRNATIFV